MLVLGAALRVGIAARARKGARLCRRCCRRCCCCCLAAAALFVVRAAPGHDVDAVAGTDVPGRFGDEPTKRFGKKERENVSFFLLLLPLL